MVVENVVIRIREIGARGAAASIAGLGLASRTAARSVRRLTLSLGALSTVGAVIGAKVFVDQADSATRLQNQIRSTTTSLEDFVEVQRGLIGISNRTRSGLENNAKLFATLQRATRGLGVENQDVLETTEGLQSAIKILGIDATTANAGLVQLGQGIQSNKFAGDELKSVLETLGPLGVRLAEELGVTVGQLRELGAAGKLQANIVFPALQRAAARFTDELDGVNFTVEDTLTVVANNFKVAVGAINNTLGATDSLNVLIQNFAQNVGVLTVQAFAFFTEAIAGTLRVAVGLIDAFNGLEVVLPGVGQTLQVVGKTFRIFFESALLGANTLAFAFTQLGIAFLETSTFGLADTSSLQQRADLLKNAIVKGAGDIGVAFDELDGVFNEVIADGVENLDPLAGRLSDIAKAAEDTAEKLRELDTPEAIESAFVRGPGGETGGTATEAEILREASVLATDVGEIFGDRIGEAIRGAFLGEGFDAFELLANIGGDLVQQALDDAIESISSSIQDVFSGLAQQLGAGGEIGSALGSALVGAIGVGIGILAAELGGTSASSRNDLVQSATESAQATRGVVAGPTSIPVFQVGQQLEDALTTTNGILELILEAILNQPAAGGGDSAGLETSGGAAADLALSTPSLA